MTAPVPNGPGLVVLPPVLDVQAAAPLMQVLTEWAGSDLRLDGSQVQRLGGQCLQVLLAAQAAWRARSSQMTIVTPSAELQSALVLLGVGPGSPLLQQEQFS